MKKKFIGLLSRRTPPPRDLELLSPQQNAATDRHFAVMCDVDHFKQYNDTYGHTAGDEVLRKIAKTLSQSCRGADQVYRCGGEEFLIVMPGDSLADARAGAERHRAAIESLQIPHEGSPFGVVTVSMGLAASGSEGREATAMSLEEAEAAVYRAKRSGRNQVAAAGLALA